MKRIVITFGMFLAMVSAVLAAEPHPLVGSWKLTAVQVNGQWQEIPEEVTQLKHITDSHFMWVQFRTEEKQILSAGGGRVALDKDKFTETVDHGLGSVTSLLGQNLTFTFKLDGDQFVQSGKLGGGTLVEKYVRLQPEQRKTATASDSSAAKQEAGAGSAN